MRGSGAPSLRQVPDCQGSRECAAATHHRETAAIMNARHHTLNGGDVEVFQGAGACVGIVPMDGMVGMGTSRMR